MGNFFQLFQHKNLGRKIDFKSVLGCHRFGNPIGFHFTFVNSPYHVVIEISGFPKMLFEEFQGFAFQFQARENTQLVHFFGGDFPHSIKFSDGQCFQKRNDLIRIDRFLAVGFVVITGNFGHEFIDRNPSRSRQTHFIENPHPNFLGQQSGTGISLLVIRDIEIGFIQREWLDQIGVFVKYLVNFVGYFFVTFESRSHKN